MIYQIRVYHFIVLSHHDCNRRDELSVRVKYSERDVYRQYFYIDIFIAHQHCEHPLRYQSFEMRRSCSRDVYYRRQQKRCHLEISPYLQYLLMV